MPHLDFRKAFSTASDAAPAVVPAQHFANHPSPAEIKTQRTLATRLPRLRRSDRTTILFAIFVFVGGLFCAFYFFNGAEILRAAAAWSREFLYPRPAIAAAQDKIDNSQKLAPPEEGRPDPKSRDGKDPISDQRSDSASSSPTVANISDGPSAFPTGSIGAGVTADLLLGQLDLPPTGGDSLLQSFNKGVDNLARATNAFANSTVTVVKGAVVQAPARTTARNATSTATNATATKGTLAHQTARNSNAKSQKGNFTGSQRGPLYAPDTIVGGSTLQSVGAMGGLGGIGGGSGAGAGVGGVSGAGGGMGLGSIGGAVGGMGGGIGGGHP